ncbi:MAG: hypothetical protein INR65_07505 [Gluconacetobacter diazotrophicus]|nr:hypothetical protein [Gluconacetobacter diazotrophicus]
MPDFAISTDRARELFGGGASGGINGNAKASIRDTETVIKLDGRTAGVVALRDGLYEACRAYVSGVIGQAAYALILSQYGDLLVSLAAPASPISDGNAATPPKTEDADHALKALLVACLDDADPTRLGGPEHNPLLHDGRGPSAACRQIVAEIADRAQAATERRPSRSPPNKS